MRLTNPSGDTLPLKRLKESYTVSLCLKHVLNVLFNKKEPKMEIIFKNGGKKLAGFFGVGGGTEMSNLIGRFSSVAPTQTLRNPGSDAACRTQLHFLILTK
jgi:hypothetical protein